jgi:hypothetical protein
MAFLRVHIMSALPQKADIRQRYSDVRFVPTPDIRRLRYSHEGSRLGLKSQ